MLRGLYRVAGAMETASRNQEIVADNLVNATTPGFRRQGMVFEVPTTTAESVSPGVPTPAARAAPHPPVVLLSRWRGPAEN